MLTSEPAAAVEDNSLTSQVGNTSSLAKCRLTAEQQFYKDFIGALNLRFDRTPGVLHDLHIALCDLRPATKRMIHRVLELLWGHNDLIHRFNNVLPDGYYIEFPSDAAKPITSIRVSTPDGTIAYCDLRAGEIPLFVPDAEAITHDIQPTILSSVSSLRFDKSLLASGYSISSEDYNLSLKRY
ncbi:hypothetical protein ACEPAF_23 [Sanghuangporus sanghuang]